MDISSFLSPPIAAPNCSSIPSSLSEYELLRLENIKRNAEYLKSLGLGESTENIQSNTNEAIGKGSTIKKRRKITRDSFNANINEHHSDGNLDGMDQRKSKRIRKISPELTSMDDLSEAVGTNRDEVYVKRPRALVCLDLDEEGGDEGPRQAVNAPLLKELILRENPSYISDGIISDEAIQHCAMRISSMSNKRLLTRMKQIATGRGDSSREKMLVFHFGLKAAGLYRMAEAALPLLPAHLCPSLPQQRGEEPEEEGEEDET